MQSDSNASCSFHRAKWGCTQCEGSKTTMHACLQKASTSDDSGDLIVATRIYQHVKHFWAMSMLRTRQHHKLCVIMNVSMHVKRNAV